MTATVSGSQSYSLAVLRKGVPTGTRAFVQAVKNTSPPVTGWKRIPRKDASELTRAGYLVVGYRLHFYGGHTIAFALVRSGRRFFEYHYSGGDEHKSDAEEFSPVGVHAAHGKCIGLGKKHRLVEMDVAFPNYHLYNGRVHPVALEELPPEAGELPEH